MKSETSKKKTKNYILSNNVVINLANIPSRRRPQRRRKRASTTETSMPQGYATTTRPTSFTNFSDLDTQIQQAKLRAIENGTNDNNRFQNQTKLINNNDTVENSVKQIMTPFLLRFQNASQEKFRQLDELTNQTKSQLDTLKTDFVNIQEIDDEEPIFDTNKYFDENDNYGAFGTIEGSDSFIAQGNNTPEVNKNNEEDLQQTLIEDTSIPQTPVVNDEDEFIFPSAEIKKKKKKKKKKQQQEEPQQEQQPEPQQEQQPEPQQQETNAMSFDLNVKSPLKTRTGNPEFKSEKLKVNIDVPPEYQQTLKNVLNSEGKKLVASKEELLPIYSYLMGGQTDTNLTASKLQSVIRKLTKGKLKNVALQQKMDVESNIPMFFDYGFA